MLNPNNDRLDYGELLAPPAGYNLDFAVGTTYSLDLDALVGASLALGLSEETDSALMSNPVCLLEALRSTGDRVALFCEGGQIHIPSKVTPLYILLEKMVYSVKTARHSGIVAFPSFHPKFWLIRFKNTEGMVRYRVIVLSRNLTFDRSWDVTYCMDGHVSKQKNERNLPLCDFLRYLIGYVSLDDNGKNKAKEIRKFITELPYVEFEPDEKEFTDYEFVLNGIQQENGEYYQVATTALFTETFHEAMIISPFVSGGIIRNFNERNLKSGIEHPRYMLITREMSLGRLKPEDVSNFTIYTMRDAVIDGEASISDDAEYTCKQDIHAKVYMTRKYSKSYLYLGSLNASHNAVYGNVEILIRLSAMNRYLNLDKLSASLFCGEKENPDNPFQQVTLQNAIIDDSVNMTNDLTAVVKEINRSNPRAVVMSEVEASYCVRVHFGECDTKGYTVEVRPLLSRKTEEYKTEMLFTNLEVTQLSEFYVVSVSDGESKVERVLIIRTEGLPEDREKAVVSSVISNRECFYRYIAFLLGDDAVLSAIEADNLKMAGKPITRKQSLQIPALYEKMLQTAATNPDKFRGIEYLMKAISEDGIIPEDFKKLYETFRKVVKING